jgi:biopolymer transport protein TolQ
MEEVIVKQAEFNIFATLFHGGPVGIFVMLLLVFLSFWVWAVILSKMRTLGALQKQSEKFLGNFWDAKSLSELNIRAKDMDYSPTREIFRSGFNEMVRVLQAREKKQVSGFVMFDTVKRSLSRQKMLEETALSKGMAVLAVCASAGPFIGLFGTVVGVIRAFQDIGASGATSLASVAPGISEALVATALGLFVAVPAVVFYNIFMNKIRSHLVILDGFSADFLNILERHYNITKPEE